MDLNTMEKGDGVELEERMAAPRETQIPLMSENSTREKRIREGLERAAPAQTVPNEERKEQATKFASNVSVAVTPFVSIAMIVIGSLYLEDCKVQPFIPIYLIVAGSMGILNSFLTICKKLFCSDSTCSKLVCGSIDGLIALFMLIWFILGCVWVYGVYGAVEYIDTSKAEYCHETLYLFAFWLLNVTFIILGLAIVLFLCGLLCIVVCLSVSD